MSKQTEKLTTVTRGRRQQFYDHPETDQLMSMLLATLSELSVTRERLFALERLACKKGLFSEEELESYKFSPEEESRLEAEQKRTLEEAFYPLNFDYRPAQKLGGERPVAANGAALDASEAEVHDDEKTQPALANG